MASSNYMNVTLQVWNGHKYSILLRQDCSLADFITAIKRTDLHMEDYIFFGRGQKLNLASEVEFHSQKKLFADTFLQVIPKMMCGSDTL